MKDSSRFKAPFREAKSALAIHWRRHRRAKTAPVGFSRFMQLPTEIRLQIWRCNEPRIIELIAEGRGHWRSPQRPPAVLSVCQESRYEAQKTYHRLRLADSRTCPCRSNYAYIDYSVDTIYFGNGCPEPIQLMALLQKQEQLQKNLLRLALQHRLWNHLVMIDRVGTIRQLGIVEELVVLCEGVEPPGRRGSEIGYEDAPHVFNFKLTRAEESRVQAEGWTFPAIKSHGITRRRAKNKVVVSRSLVDQPHPWLTWGLVLCLCRTRDLPEMSRWDRATYPD